MMAGTESGDSHVVRQLPEGALAAVIDGVGHGNEAADAARIAGDTLTSAPHEDAVSLVWRCHEALKDTRGVVMTLLFFSPGGAMTWVGVGNIEGVIFHCDSSGRTRDQSRRAARRRDRPSSAAAARRKPAAAAARHGHSGDRRHPARVLRPLVPGHEPQAIADRILARYRKGTDDALVLVVRCLGDQS